MSLNPMLNRQPDVTVIISTYNAPRWLELVVEGYCAQRFSGTFELLIADDGSTEHTERLIYDLARRNSLSIRHVWQPDDGFQKCRILNKAIAASRGSMLLFTDGDCIPPPHMLKTHLDRSKRGSFLTGGYLKLPQLLSSQITTDLIRAGLPFKPTWLVRHGYPVSTKLLKLMLPSPFDQLANHITPTKRTWNGHNASCFKKDAIAVNGFNEAMQYGGEDVEFGLRLNYSGIRGRHLRFSCTPVHLYHQHDYVMPGMREKNKHISRQTRQVRRVKAELGLSQWRTDNAERK